MRIICFYDVKRDGTCRLMSKEEEILLTEKQFLQQNTAQDHYF